MVAKDLKLGAFFFGGVEMDDAGAGLPNPMDRRYSNDACWKATLDYVNSAKEAERLGFDSFWTTEHHFQYEGYEVIPNGLLISTWIAAHTTTLRFGSMFNVVPQWNPLRLAEDFSTLHNLSGGRAMLGVGRGTVPREAWSLGTVVASGDNAMSAEHDRINREVFEESLEIIKLAWYNERFSYRGKHFVFPPDDIPDRGSYVDDLTLIPKPLRTIDIYQPVTSPETIEYVPRVGHKAVYWLQNADSQRQKWDRYAEIRAEIGTPVAPGEDRMLVINMHTAKTREQAMVKGKPGHDEFANFLSPYGRFSSYRNTDGSKVAFNHCPTVQESIDQKIQIVGSFDDAVDTIGFWRDLLDLKHICFFFDYPGVSREEMNEQMHFMADEIFPRLGEEIDRRELPNLEPLI